MCACTVIQNGWKFISSAYELVVAEEGEVDLEDEEPPASNKKKGLISKLIRDLFKAGSNSTSPVSKV